MQPIVQLPQFNLEGIFSIYLSVSCESVLKSSPWPRHIISTTSSLSDRPVIRSRKRTRLAQCNQALTDLQQLFNDPVIL